MPVQYISAEYGGTGIEFPVCLGFYLYFLIEQSGETNRTYFLYSVSPSLHLPSSFQ